MNYIKCALSCFVSVLEPISSFVITFVTEIIRRVTSSKTDLFALQQNRTKLLGRIPAL